LTCYAKFHTKYITDVSWSAGLPKTQAYVTKMCVTLQAKEMATQTTQEPSFLDTNHAGHHHKG